MLSCVEYAKSAARNRERLREGWRWERGEEEENGIVVVAKLLLELVAIT